MRGDVYEFAALVEKVTPVELGGIEKAHLRWGPVAEHERAWRHATRGSGVPVDDLIEQLHANERVLVGARTVDRGQRHIEQSEVDQQLAAVMIEMIEEEAPDV